LERNVSEENVVMLGGKAWDQIPQEKVSFDQFAWLQTAADRAGLNTELKRTLAPLLEAALNEKVGITEETAEDLSDMILRRCFEGEAHLDLLAGILVEKGRKWQRTEAEKNRDFFAGLVGQDVEKVTMLIAQIALAFFWKGLESIATSQKSSSLRVVIDALQKTQAESEPVPDLAEISESLE
jgi:hypothetical protein